MLNKKFISTLCLLIVLSCAHQMTPGGGPDDKTGPVVLSVSPDLKSVNVNRNTEIRFTFSEWIDKKSDKGISIFPPVEFKSKIKGNSLIIKPVTELAESTTYHVEAGSMLKDLRGNPVTTPYSLIFSTGPTLDSGAISGCVVDPSKNLLQPRIALFSPKEKADSGFSGPPSYLLQTDSTGHFSFNNIKTGIYTIIGYLDLNNDSRLQPVTEQVYMPADSIIKVQSSPAEIVLYPAVYDTAFPKIASLQAQGTVLTGKWNKPFDSLSLMQPGFKIEHAGESSGKIPEFTYLPFTNTNRFALRTSEPFKTGQYRLIYILSRNYSSESAADTAAFTVQDGTDTVPPVLTSWTSDKPADLLPSIKINWSEPVLLRDSLIMTDSSGDTVLLSTNRLFSDSLTLVPLKKLQPGTSYNLVLFKHSGEDLSGNPLKTKDTTTDTVAKITLSTLNIDSLASSIQGGAECLKGEKGAKWRFSLFNGKTYTTNDSAGSFYFEMIPSGKGLMGYFIDRNGNDIPDPGKLIPWTAPEKQIMSPDTVEARARWDIEGLQIRVCDPCSR